MSSREFVLGRIRAALADVPRDEDPADVPVPRTYARAQLAGADGDHGDEAGAGANNAADAGVRAVLVGNLREYRAVVHEVTEDQLPATIARVLGARGTRRLAVPAGLPPGWLGDLPPEVEVACDGPHLTVDQLDRADTTALTGCAVAVAGTGTVVLDAGPAQGRRVLTLVPDHHVCVVMPGQIVASVPQAVARLDPARPLTWISGPSATSDIELDRVEGVHGPRTLEVVVVTDGTGEAPAGHG